MTITRPQGLALIERWVTDPALRSHLSEVEAVMTRACEEYGPEPSDPERWGLAGLLHDADWELAPDEHPNRVVAWLRAEGDDELADAIATHHTSWGPAETPMGRALLAFDELTGFVVAVARIYPEGIHEVTPARVAKKLKRSSFAASVERSEVAAGAEALGITVDEASAFVIGVLQARALIAPGATGPEG